MTRIHKILDVFSLTGGATIGLLVAAISIQFLQFLAA